MVSVNAHSKQLSYLYNLNLPEELLRSLTGLPGFDPAAFEVVHESVEQVTSIRLNPAKRSLGGLQLAGSSVIPWSTQGYYLPERPLFTLDPLLHAGAYYVQEASSMFLEEALKQTTDLLQPLKVLDLCAAPGGKSTLLQSIISKESLLVSNEVIKTRVNILAENITKWGAANVVVTNNDPTHFQRLENYFDVIVIDAPCSGSGLFRRDPSAINEWSLNNVQLCCQRQQRILADVMPALKDGGTLIYSTCSYSKEEDENIIEWIMANCSMENLQLKLDHDWGIVETAVNSNYGYRFYPNRLKGEGLFITCFKKNGDQAGFERPAKKDQSQRSKKEDKLTAKEIDAVKKFVTNTDELFFMRVKDEIIALPAGLQNEIPVLQSALYIKKAGIKLGRLIGNELVPDHELALSTIISKDVARIDADKQTALHYLRREDININQDLKGWALVCYEGLPLGWIKILSNRINNYYPKDWRIMMKA